MDLELSIFAYCKDNGGGFIREGRVVVGILGGGGKGYHSVDCVLPWRRT